MLEALRRHSKGWVASFFMGLLVLSFAVWGIGDMFRGRSDNSVASVGSDKISGLELQQAFQRQLAALRERYPEFDSDQAKAMGLDRRVLSELVGVKTFDIAAREMGVGMPDDLVVKEIHDMPGFKGATGSFDRTRFEMVLRENNFSEARFVEALRSDLTRRQIFDALLGGMPVPDSIAGPLIAFQAERRVARYVVVPPDKAGAVAPVTDDEVKTRYEADKSRFMAPEYRSFVFVDLDPGALAGTIKVSDEAVKALYEKRKSQFVTPEKRKIEQIVYPDQAAAKAAVEAAKAGQSFADLAKARGLAASDIEMGVKAQSALDPKFAAPVFAAKAGEIVGPLEGTFGWTLIRVAAITPAGTKSLDELRPELQAEAAKEAAKDKVYKLANDFENARNGGTPLAAAAKAIGVQAVTVTASDAQGKDPQGADVPGLKDKTTLLQEAFKAHVDEERDLVQTPQGGYLAVRVQGVTPPALRPLAAVAGEIRKTLEDEHRQAATEKAAQALAAKGTAGTSLDALARELGRAPLKSDPLTRTSTNDVFSAAALEALFAAKPGAFLAAPVGNGDSAVLMQLDEIQKPSPAEIEAAYPKIKPRLGEIFAGEIADIYGEALQTRYGVKINERGLKNALGES